MRDEYYDEIDDIQMGDVDDEWLDEDPYEEPEPVRRTEAQPNRQLESRRRLEREPEPRRRQDERRDRRERRVSDPTPASKSAGKTSPAGDLLLLLFKIGLVAMFLIFMTTFFFGITQARDTSMEPAVKEGDLVIYYRPDKSYAVGDAIVVDYNGSLQVRRVVATEGDTVDISADGGLIVNGSTQIEDDIYTTTYPYTDGITFPVTVGSGEVFVLGDNRTSAEDSRMYGTVRISATKGAVMTVIRRRGI